MSWTNEYFGPELATKSGNKATSEVLEGKKLVGIYFSAHWCPPCRQFTPVLGQFYNAINAQDPSALEVIFVSSDSDENSFKHYWDTQPWSALPFDSDYKELLGNKFQVAGIPTFIILDAATGDVIDSGARSTVMSMKNDIPGALKKWIK